MSQQHTPGSDKDRTAGVDGGSFGTPPRGGVSQTVGTIAKQIQRDLMRRSKAPEDLHTPERQN
ncbi:MAG: hypothetical protein WC004_05330 [Candidatus Absconditabacterales bacterium]